MDLTEFLAARLDEDERAALDAGSGAWYDHLDESNLSEWDIKHAARHDPARVLRDVEAGRKILADLPAYSKQRRDLRDHVYLPENADYHSGHADGTDDAAYYVLRWLAAVWSDHPDYDEAWRP